ncbi:unnamed protein product, partial [Prorocentrum cordatum]
DGAEAAVEHLRKVIPQGKTVYAGDLDVMTEHNERVSNDNSFKDKMSRKEEGVASQRQAIEMATTVAALASSKRKRSRKALARTVQIATDVSTSGLKAGAADLHYGLPLADLRRAWALERGRLTMELHGPEALPSHVRCAHHFWAKVGICKDLLATGSVSFLLWMDTDAAPNPIVDASSDHGSAAKALLNEWWTQRRPSTWKPRGRQGSGPGYEQTVFDELFAPRKSATLASQEVFCEQQKLNAVTPFMHFYGRAQWIGKSQISKWSFKVVLVAAVRALLLVAVVFVVLVLLLVADPNFDALIGVALRDMTGDLQSLPVLAQAVAKVFYRQAQEDAHEFLMELLDPNRAKRVAVPFCYVNTESIHCRGANCDGEIGVKEMRPRTCVEAPVLTGEGSRITTTQDALDEAYRARAVAGVGGRGSTNAGGAGTGRAPPIAAHPDFAGKVARTRRKDKTGGGGAFAGVPGDPEDPPRPWGEALAEDRAVELPAAHCAFRGCRWSGDTEMELIAHVAAEHGDVLQPIADTYSPAHEESERMLAAHSEVVSQRCAGPAAARKSRKESEAWQEKVQEKFKIRCAKCKNFLKTEGGAGKSAGKNGGKASVQTLSIAELPVGADTMLANLSPATIRYTTQVKVIGHFLDWSSKNGSILRKLLVRDTANTTMGLKTFRLHPVNSVAVGTILSIKNVDVTEYQGGVGIVPDDHAEQFVDDWCEAWCLEEAQAEQDGLFTVLVTLRSVGDPVQSEKGRWVRTFEASDPTGTMKLKLWDEPPGATTTKGRGAFYRACICPERKPLAAAGDNHDGPRCFLQSLYLSGAQASGSCRIPLSGQVGSTDVAPVREGAAAATAAPPELRGGASAGASAPALGTPQGVAGAASAAGEPTGSAAESGADAEEKAGQAGWQLMARGFELRAGMAVHGER